MALTTLLGSAHLAMQEALGSGLDAVTTTPRAPNFLLVSLRRASFVTEHRGKPGDELEHFRRELEGGMREFVASHGWSVGGSGTIFINLLLKDMEEPCRVEARIARSVYTLGVSDDRGSRELAIGSNPTIIGRDHQPYPRGFVAIHDSLRLFSREHLLLTYVDRQLRVRLLGQNPTALNDGLLEREEREIVKGDVIACGNCRIRIVDIER